MHRQVFAIADRIVSAIPMYYRLSQCTKVTGLPDYNFVNSKVLVARPSAHCWRRQCPRFATRLERKPPTEKGVPESQVAVKVF